MTSTHNRRLLSRWTCGFIILQLGSVGASFAQESWMTERQAAAASQRKLERLADQARQPNSPSPKSRNLLPTAQETKEADDRAQQEQARAVVQRQRDQDERDAVRQQQRQALELRFREIDAASADMSARFYQRAQARLAIARPLLAEGPNSANLSAYCDAMGIYTDDPIQADPALVVRSLETALKIDETHAGCWGRYYELLSLLSPYAGKLFKRIDYSTIGLAPRDQIEAGRLIEVRYRALKKAADRRQAAVATYVDPTRRLAPPQLPERYATWQQLKSKSEPEARYWQSRVHVMGLLGQPVNPEAAREAACSPDAGAYFRNRLNCLLWSKQGVALSTMELYNLKVLLEVTADARDPKFYQKDSELPQIMSQRADRAVGLAIYANRAFSQSETGSGKLPHSNTVEPATVVAKYYRTEACKALEEAIALGHYDRGRDVYNLLACYDRGEIQAPTGARSRVFAVLESEANPSLKSHVLDLADQP